MNKMKLFAIRDFLTGFLAPLMEQNEQVAIRNWVYAVNNAEQSQFFIHPKDYCLYYIGEYDLETGRISALPEPVPVLSALEAKNMAGKENTDGE